MKKTFCDFCGVEVPPLQRLGSGYIGGSYELMISHPSPQSILSFNRDLCKDCYYKVERLLKEIPKNED